MTHFFSGLLHLQVNFRPCVSWSLCIVLVKQTLCILGRGLVDILSVSSSSEYTTSRLGNHNHLSFHYISSSDSFGREKCYE